MQLSCFLFINRKWEQDKREFERKLYYFNTIDYPLQLLLFPEGGDLTVKTRARSDQFARENSLPCYRYCFHPRTTGFNYIMDALRDGGLDAVYDVTIAYPDLLPKTELDAWKGFYPCEVHFHVKSYTNEDIPEDEDGKKAWLTERWAEKEQRLKEFYTHKEFREVGVNDRNGVNDCNSVNDCNGVNDRVNEVLNRSKRSPEVVKPHNIPFLLYSIFIFISTNAVLIIPLLYVPYFWLYMLCCAVYQVLRGYWGLSEYVMRPKLKDVEQAIQRSKYVTQQSSS